MFSWWRNTKIVNTCPQASHSSIPNANNEAGGFLLYKCTAMTWMLNTDSVSSKKNTIFPFLKNKSQGIIWSGQHVFPDVDLSFTPIKLLLNPKNPEAIKKDREVKLVNYLTEFRIFSSQWPKHSMLYFPQAWWFLPYPIQGLPLQVLSFLNPNSTQNQM